MAVIPKQDIGFYFGAVQQAKNKRGLRPGELIEAINVRQIVEDEYRKRPGFDRVVPTAESGSLTTPWESFISDGISQIGRDGADGVWRRDSSTWRVRGTAKRAFPTTKPTTLVPSAARPVMVLAGGNYWVFTTGSGSYTWSIFDTSGNVVKTASTVTAASITTLAVEQDGTNVWVLWSAGGTTVTSHKYVIATPSVAAVAATYVTITTGIRGVDAHRLASGSIAVAITRAVPDGSSAHLHVSYLDTATGAAAASPTPVTTSVGGHTQISISAPSIFLSDGTNGSWYVALWTPRGADYTGQSAVANNLALATITASTLATAVVGIATTPDTTDLRAWAVGYLAGNGDRVIYATPYTHSGSPTYPAPYVLTRYTYTGSTTTLVLRRYSYPVSKPQAVGSSFYLLTGFDDGPSFAFSRSYFLIDSDGKIITQLDYGIAAPAGLLADSTDTLSYLGFATPLRVSGTKLECSLLINTGSGGGTAGINDFAPAFVSCDTGAAYAAPTKQRDSIALWPGGVPTLAGTSDVVREIAPMLSPVNATFTAGTGAALAGPTTIQYVYRMIDADGTIYRSAPSPAQTQTFNSVGRAVIVKPLTHMLPNTTAQIELYLSEVNSTEPILYTVVANDTTVDTISITVVPETIPDNETIYTFGGGLDNSPLPQALAVSTWRNRTIVLSGSEIWPSLERDAGLGPRFNEALVTTWDDGEGDILAGAPVDWNYFAIFKRDGAAVISGPGPNPTPGGGVNGNYETQTLRIRKGQINDRSVVTGPQGCYFQSLADGRIYCVATSLEVIDVSQGMESYRTGTVTATNYVEKDRQLHFHMDDGSILVLDYAHPTPEQPAGRWSQWDSAGILVTCGATIDTTGTPVHLETAGAIRTPGSGFQDATSTTPENVLMTLTTGDLAAAGQIKGSYRLDAVHMLGEFVATNTPVITVTSDYGVTVTTHTSAAITAGPEECYIRPRNHDRAQATRIKVAETASTGEGFIFTGIVLTIQSLGMAKFPNNSRRVA